MSNWGGWLLKPVGAEDHVVPIDDLREHDEKITCWCCPKRDTEEPLVVLHNALDGREEFEQGRKTS